MNNLGNEIENYLISNSNKIKINSQDIIEGDVFCALQGSNTHGNKYISSALSNKAKYVITDRQWDENHNKNIFKVQNTFDFLYRVAIKKRNQFNGNIIAITGSVGKTSIKEAIYFILKNKINVQKNDGNFNNLIGMPFSLAKFNKNIDLGILELGMNQKGEIKKLSNICMPDIALITKISNAHIGNFGNLKDIALAKSEIFCGMNNLGIAILNDSDPYLSILKERAKLYGIKQFIFFGKSKKSEISLLKVEYQKNYKYKVYVNAFGKKVNFLLNNFGEHWIENSLAAISVLTAIGQDPCHFSEEIKNFKAIKGRGKILKITFNKKKMIFNNFF